MRATLRSPWLAAVAALAPFACSCIGGGGGIENGTARNGFGGEADQCIYVEGLFGVCESGVCPVDFAFAGHTRLVKVRDLGVLGWFFDDYLLRIWG